MKEKHQLENPNNSRIFIDYRKQKDKVRFEYVGKQSIFSIVYTVCLDCWLYKGIWLIGSPMIFTIIFFLLQSTNMAYHVLAFFILINYVAIIPLIATAYIILKPGMLKWVPHISAFKSDSYEVTFSAKDVKYNKLTLPLFNNVLMDYEATGEMSKYLERVEIIEHPFNRYVRRKKKPQEYLWRADFYFSQKPKSGEIKIIFT